MSFQQYPGQPVNMTFTKAGLTGISGAATTYSTGSAAQLYCVNGKSYTKTQVSGGTTPTSDSSSSVSPNPGIALVANQGTVVVWTLNAAGTVAVYKGTVEALDSAGNFTKAPSFPLLPDTVTAFAYTLHKAGSTTSGTWTFGTSNWNATGLTHTVVDINALPDRPQTS